MTYSEETIRKATRYVFGTPATKKEMLFDRMGSRGNWDFPDKFKVPREYYCPCIVIEGKKIGAVGPSGFVGFYTRKEALAEAIAFQDQCKSIVEGNLSGEEIRLGRSL